MTALGQEAEVIFCAYLVGKILFCVAEEQLNKLLIREKMKTSPSSAPWYKTEIIKGSLIRYFQLLTFFNKSVSPMAVNTGWKTFGIFAKIREYIRIYCECLREFS